ncbi:hypothetical protein F8S13_25850 [Chloroflexia bacterium SDU3-3]|nr:hypothetical protein F8S13_25850 [Chloroflexia bacterium SDU3-3]
MQVKVAPSSASVLPQVMVQQRPEGYVLSDSIRRGCETTFITVFTVGWNLIACPISLAFFFSPPSQNPITLLLTRLLPIMFIGLGMLLVVYVARKLLIVSAFEAAELTLPSWPLRLGERTNVTFRQRSRWAAITTIEASLQCAEVVTYRVGTDTRTVREVVWEQALASSDLTNGQKQVEAQWSIQIPRDMQPSFATMRNNIEWNVVVKLHSPRFPDAESQFLLVVLPEVVD